MGRTIRFEKKKIAWVGVGRTHSGKRKKEGTASPNKTNKKRNTPKRGTLVRTEEKPLFALRLGGGG